MNAKIGRLDRLKASFFCVLTLVLILAPLSGFCARNDFPGVQRPPSIEDYFEPGSVQQSEPLPIKQVIGLVITGLASLTILLFVFSFLIGPGEKVREKISEKSDPFFTIVAILLVVLFLAILQTYYNDLLAWLKTAVSSG